MLTYQVKANDTGVDIAKAQGITLAQLINANPGVNWDNLRVGYHLHIPSNRTAKYTIADGDTGLALAGRLGIPFDQLENLNPGTKWSQLKPGDTLNIPAAESLIKDSVGSPVSGVPAQMPPPTVVQATSMSDSTREITRKKVAEFIGGSDNLTTAFGKVGALDWVGCFALIRKHSLSKPQPAGGPLLAVVDLRDPNNSSDKLAVPWKIPASFTLPCIEAKPNASVFDNASKSKDFTLLFSDFKTLRDVIFVDTHGHFRAPEMATRYAQWLVKNNTASAPEPTIYFMSGGLAAYCNAQSFGRIILNTPNPFVAGWPTSL